MDPQRWAKIEALFQAVLAKAPAERAPYLAGCCVEDSSLRSEVESLLNYGGAKLSAAMGGGPALAKIWEDAGVAATIEFSQMAGTVIGPYHLQQQIGTGGMGVVWLAEQKHPVRRRVAVKLIKAGMDTSEVVARFESERQALALMDHPAVAKVFDAGSTSTGRPYFVMEYVPGIPITDYCDKHKLTVFERLRLFVQVCEGVKHAHQKAIIHRDLKPSNILVTESDGKALPRIIDFGVAKAVSQKLSEHTVLTRVGAMLGTPEYMSPEQADSAGEDIDTRTDVYSLGVVLYELLVGTVPLDFSKLTFDEMLRKLRQDDAPRPSTKLRTLGKQSTITAQNRGAQSKALRRQLHGDLDSIVLKALEKDRVRRYGGPSELAADIEHYLRYEPVAARPASAGYRVWKYMRRHRIGVAFAASLALLLVAGVVVSTWMALRAMRAEQEALAVRDFLQNGVLKQASADDQDSARYKPDPELKVRTALDRAAAKIEGKFGKQPSVEASIRETIGGTYVDLGLCSLAQPQIERALDLRRRILGATHRDTLVSMRTLCLVYEGAGNYKGAETLFSETVEAERRVLGENNSKTLDSENDQASLYSKEGKYAQAEMLYRKLLNVQQRRLREDNSVTLAVEVNLVGVYMNEGKYAEAEPMYKRLVNSMLHVHGENHHHTLLTMGNLAMLYGFEEKFDESAELYSRVVNGLRQVEGKEHPETLMMAEGLAWAWDHQGKYAQADALFSEVLSAYGRVLGKDHPLALVTMTDMGASYRRRGMNMQAETLFVTVLEGRRRKLGAASPDTLATMGDLGWLYVSEGRYFEAEPLLQEAASSFEKARSNDWERYRVMCALGASLAGEKQYVQAEPLLLEGYQQMMDRKATIPADGRFELGQAGAGIVRLYQDWGKPDKANEWQQKLREAGSPRPS